MAGDQAAGTVAAAAWLRDATRDLRPGPPVQTVYRPLDYAWDVHAAYLERFGGPKRLLLVGMNPGPWGMGQTGVPFGDPPLAADWMGLAGAEVHPPPESEQLEKRPVLGWDSPRSEASGQRLWGFLRDRYGEAERALRDMLVVNHCPLLFFDEAARNVTPDKLRKADREAVDQVCLEGLRRMARATHASALVGVGKYAESKCRMLADDLDVEVASILHPSPASPLANRDGGRHWRKQVAGVLDGFGV